MVVNLYRSKTPVAVFTLPVIVAIICIPLFIRTPETQVYYFQWQTQFFGWVHQYPALNFFLSGGFMSLIAHQLNVVFNRNAYYSKDTYLPGLIYVLGIAAFETIDFSPFLISQLFLTWGLAAFLQLKRQEPAKNLVFIGSFLLGVSIVFSPLLITLVLFPWLALAVIKPFVWREYIIALLGLVLPTLYHYFFYFLATGEPNIAQADMKLIAPESDWSVSKIVAFSFFGLCSIFALLKFYIVIRSQVVNFKKISQITLLILLISFLSFLLGWYVYGQAHIGFLVPLSFIFGVWLLYTEKNVLPSLLILFWMLASIFNLYT